MPSVNKRANAVSAIKYASKDNIQYLLVFMTLGEVLCLDTIRETFDTIGDSHVISNVNKQSLIDVQRYNCLSMSDRGKGKLQKIIISDGSASSSVLS